MHNINVKSLDIEGKKNFIITIGKKIYINTNKYKYLKYSKITILNTVKTVMGFLLTSTI